MNSIDRQGRLSLYHQLYEILHRDILMGRLKPGDQLPTEKELINQYEVSRITVRRVLNMLVQEGLIYRQAGRGSFVAHATLEHALSHIVSFTEDMRRRGFEVSTRVLFSGLAASRIRWAGGKQVVEVYDEHKSQDVGAHVDFMGDFSNLRAGGYHHRARRVLEV